MDLGSAKFEWFPYIPNFKDNRTQPEDQQLRLEIRRMSSLDQLDQISWGEDGAMHTWRDQHLQKHLQDSTAGAVLRRVPEGVLIRLRQFMENTRHFENFIIDGVANTDPVEIFFHLSSQILAADSLLNEINNAIVWATMITGDELKNFKAQCDGSKPLKNIVLPVQPGSDPTSADTPLAASAASTSGVGTTPNAASAPA